MLVKTRTFDSNGMVTKMGRNTRFDSSDGFMKESELIELTTLELIDRATKSKL